jgi:ankyrin repeat protein
MGPEVMLRPLPQRLPVVATLLATMMWALGCAQAVAAEPVLRCPAGPGDLVDLTSRTAIEAALSKEAPIFLALERGDLHKVRRILAARPSLQVCGLGLTPLAHAATRKSPQAVALLLNAGAPIDSPRDEFGRTALHVAAEFGNFEVARLLLKRGANVRATSDGGATVLHHLMASGLPQTELGRHRQLVLAAELIRRGVPADEAPPGLKKKTALMLAAATGHVDLVALLLELGANPRLQDSGGQTALQTALVTHFATADLLLDHGASATTPDGTGGTPLQSLASALVGNEAERVQQVEMAGRLVQKGARVDAADHQGVTPLMMATALRNQNLVAWLLNRGANPLLADAKGETSLSRAQQLGDAMLLATFEREHYLRPLRADHTDEFIAKLEGCQAPKYLALANELLMPAVMRGNAAAMSALVQCGANLNERHHIEIGGVPSELTPLVFAAGELGNAKLVAAMVEGGAALDMRATSAKGYSSYTALSAALSSGHLGIAMYLIERGADVNAADSRNGLTPLMRAVSGDGAQKQHQLLPVIELLLSRGAAVNARSRDGMTALHLASIAGDAQAIRLLLQHGADADIRDDSKMTALDYARKVRAQEAEMALRTARKVK